MIYNGFKLGVWVSNQKRREKLTEEKIKQFESLKNWRWNSFDDLWNEGFEYLKKYIDEHGHAQIKRRSKYQDFNLGAWASKQRVKYKKNDLDLEKVKKLESLPYWLWSIEE